MTTDMSLNTAAAVSRIVVLPEIESRAIEHTKPLYVQDIYKL
jgi:hypothetical protein